MSLLSAERSMDSQHQTQRRLTVRERCVPWGALLRPESSRSLGLGLAYTPRGKRAAHGRCPRGRGARGQGAHHNAFDARRLGQQRLLGFHGFPEQARARRRRRQPARLRRRFRPWGWFAATRGRTFLHSVERRYGQPPLLDGLFVGCVCVGLARSGGWSVISTQLCREPIYGAKAYNFA